MSFVEWLKKNVPKWYFDQNCELDKATVELFDKMLVFGFREDFVFKEFVKVLMQVSSNLDLLNQMDSIADLHRYCAEMVYAGMLVKQGPAILATIDKQMDKEKKTVEG